MALRNLRWTLRSQPGAAGKPGAQRNNTTLLESGDVLQAFGSGLSPSWARLLEARPTAPHSPRLSQLSRPLLNPIDPLAAHSRKRIHQRG
jgi:hypothetical protein